MTAFVAPASVGAFAPLARQQKEHLSFWRSRCRVTTVHRSASLRAQRSNPDKIIQKTIRQVTQQKDWIAMLRSQ